MPGSAADLTFCNWLVRSEIEIVGAPKWDAPINRSPDIHVVFGSVPPPESISESEFQRYNSSEEETFIDYRHIARYHVKRDGVVIVQPYKDSCIDYAGLPIHTAVQPFLHLYKGLGSLHAGVVVVDGRAYAILGNSGRGKTTLIAAMSQRGFKFLAEEHCVMEMGSPDQTIVKPVMPILRLWRDSLSSLGLRWADHAATLQGGSKHYLLAPEWFHNRPAKLDGLILLRDKNAATAPAIPAPLKGPHGLTILSWQRQCRLLPWARDDAQRTINTLVSFMREYRAWQMKVDWPMDDLGQGVESVLSVIERIRLRG